MRASDFGYFNPRRISSASTVGSLPRNALYDFIGSRLDPRLRISFLKSLPFSGVQPPFAIM